MNELVAHKSWFSKNWKWLIPLLMVFMIGLFAITTSKVGEGIATVAKAYGDVTLYEDALEKAKNNKEIINLLGEIEPIDNLAILEGTTFYSNSNNSIKTSIRIVGDKARGKLDISADKEGSQWRYKKIGVRVRAPKQTIIVLEE